MLINSESAILVLDPYVLNSITLQIDGGCLLDVPPKCAQSVLSILVSDRQDGESRQLLAPTGGNW